MAPNRPFVVDPVLTAIAIGYTNPAHTLIADQVLPRVPVLQEQFKYTEYPLAEGFTYPETEVGRKGRVNTVEFSGTEKTGSTTDHGLDAPVPNSDIKVAAAARAQGRSVYDPEARAAEGVANLIQLAREVRVAGIVHNLNSYAAARRVTLAGTAQFSDYANSDPIAVLRAGFDGTLVYRPNTMVMGRSVWGKISSHPDLVNAVRGNLTNKGILTPEEFVSLFSGDGLKKLLIGEPMVNVAKKGQAAQLAQVWGKHIAMLHIDPAANTDQGITFGMTAQFGEKIAGRIEDEDIGLEGGTRIRVGEKVREVVIAQDVGYFVQNAVA
ncbi:capsid protein [Kaistia algarum]|uniref:capsid protein n=1 Tax=Kaistia algarum TaxID=2083279 RepID=UPI000CE923F7|nr:capsid protein [Kaistia algarum]MCX5512273.1 capsid protein [Kaistia algarum]PPE80364.1 capsid protein [Kaistia algarum]